MQYLCRKSLTVGGVKFHPGDRIPDGVVLPERTVVLKRMGYISEYELIDSETDLGNPTEEIYQTDRKEPKGRKKGRQSHDFYEKEF